MGCPLSTPQERRSGPPGLSPEPRILQRQVRRPHSCPDGAAEAAAAAAARAAAVAPPRPVQMRRGAVRPRCCCCLPGAALVQQTLPPESGAAAMGCCCCHYQARVRRQLWTQRRPEPSAQSPGQPCGSEGACPHLPQRLSIPLPTHLRMSMRTARKSMCARSSVSPALPGSAASSASSSDSRSRRVAVASASR